MRQLPLSKTAYAVWCFLLIILSASFVAHAQQLMPIYVTFAWPVDIPSEDQRQINKAILDILGQEFHFWAFRENEGNRFPRLTISARKGARWFLLMDFRTASDWRKEWSATLYEEGELARQGNPAGGQWEPKITDVFRNVLIDPEFDEIREKFLNHVAISQNLLQVPNLPETLALIPLPWNVFNSLGMSEFKIQSRVSNGVVLLHSYGKGTRAQSAAPSSVSGILIEHILWEVPGHAPESLTGHSGELAKVNVEFVYVEKFNDWVPPADVTASDPAGQLSIAQ